MRRAGFLRGISHPAAISGELPIKGVSDKETRFTVANERQDSDVLCCGTGNSSHVKDKPAIWRPARGPYSLIRVLRRQQQLLTTGPVGIHLVNAPPSPRSAAEQNAATIRRPGRIAVANPRIVGEANVDTARQFVHPDIRGRITYCVVRDLCSIRRESQGPIAPLFTSTQLFTGAVKPSDLFLS